MFKTYDRVLEALNKDKIMDCIHNNLSVEVQLEGEGDLSADTTRGYVRIKARVLLFWDGEKISESSDYVYIS